MDARTAENKTGEDGIVWVRWAHPVRPDQVRRLHETDARGVADEELTDNSGCALCLRCRSILR